VRRRDNIAGTKEHTMILLENVSKQYDGDRYAETTEP